MSNEAKQDWFASVFPLFRLGMLDDADRLEVERLLESKEAYRELAARFDAKAEHFRTMGTPHIPKSLLVPWEPGELAGLERLGVRQHLEECASCRRVVANQGGDPTLSEVPHLESPMLELEPPASSVSRDEAQPKAPFFRTWTFGGASALSLAAILLIAFLGPWSSPDPVTIELPSSSRGSAGEVNVPQQRDNIAQLFQLPSLPIDDEVAVTARLLDSEGRLIWSQFLESSSETGLIPAFSIVPSTDGPLVGAHTLEVVSDGRPIYSIRLTWDP